MFVIQHNVLNENILTTLNDILIKNKIPYMYVGMIPFSQAIVSNEPLIGNDFLPYGSTSFTIETQKRGWRGQYYNPETFRIEVWNQYRNDLLNNSMITTILDAIDFLKKQNDDKLWFTRPTEDLKAYSGRVINTKECISWFIKSLECSSSVNDQLQPSTPIIISEPKDIQMEWRWFIVDGKIVDGSIYRIKELFHKEHETCKYVIKEAQKFANQWLPNKCCVMDLALVNDKMYLVEFNTINASGFYDNDIEKIVVSLWKYFKKNS